MSRKVGRSLLATEHVHHIDGNPFNNDITNLQLLTADEHRDLHNPDRRTPQWRKANCKARMKVYARAYYQRKKAERGA